MNLEPLTEENFLLFAAKHYDARLSASTAEFQEDLDRIKYIRKLITRYQNNDVLKERLILNHIIVLANVFGPEISVKMLYFKLSDQFEFIKPFLVFLSIIPDKIYNIGDQEIVFLDEIEMDPGIIESLRKI